MLDLQVQPLEALRRIKQALSEKGVRAGFVVPSPACLSQGAVVLNDQAREYLRKAGLLGRPADAGAATGAGLTAWHVGPDSMEQAMASFAQPTDSHGALRLAISNLESFASAGDVLALLVLDGDLYVANVSEPAVLESAIRGESPLGDLVQKLSSAKGLAVDRFSEWNARLLGSFMSEASRGEEVFLRVDPDVLDEIGQDLGGDAGFVAAVRVGPAWATPGASFEQQVQSLVRQRRRVAGLPPRDVHEPQRIAAAARAEGYVDPGALEPAYVGRAAPAYLPYLAMLVRVAATDSNDGFYRRLQQALGLPPSFGSGQMALLESAWSDLEDWTRAQDGRFGLFKLRRLGGYQHIGVPQSQSILKPHDVQRMPLVFKRAEIRPDGDLGEAAIRRIMAEARAEAARPGSFFSTPFAAALEKPAFEAPIASILRAIYEDWDGTLPERNRGQSEDPVSARMPRVGLCLSLAEEQPLRFDIHWRLPPVHDSGTFEVRRGGDAWTGAYVGADGGVTNVAEQGSQHAAWRLAAKSLGGDVELEVVSQPGEESEESIEKAMLARHLLWILVPGHGGPEGRPWLREGELPGYGAAFLLAPPGNADNLSRYLDREQPSHDVMVADGVPAGWLLVRLNDCSSLTESQRSLPDAADPHPTPRLIRFAGGRSVRRGFSSMFLPYDLPDVEFDAPPGAEIEFPDGLAAREITVVRDGTPSSELGSSVRRYELRLLRPGSGSYQIKASLDGKPIGRAAVLRISGTDGDVVRGGEFSLDELGRPQASNSGLSGVLPEATTAEFAGLEESAPIALDPHWLGIPLAGRDFSPGVEEKFLDELAQADSGSMDIGVAQKCVARLLAAAPRFDDPKFLIMQLRSRGHVEVATTNKGHMSRVHSVRPTIYPLPVACNGKAVYGVLGTLRLVHWEKLASNIPGVKAVAEKTRGRRFQAIRLVEELPGAVREACSPSGALGGMGFQLASPPSLAISSWCESFAAVRSTTLRNPMESIGRAAEAATRFNPATGLFKAAPSQTPHELWRTKDLDTGFGLVHYLVETDEEVGRKKHAFVRDSRWGAWIALESFVNYLKLRHGMEGVHPFPITYQAESCTVWLPARLGLPVALERALVLCAGSATELFELEGAPDPIEPSTRLALGLANDAEARVRVSTVFSGMATGKWLAYRWVPRGVAEVVAMKLGALLDVV